MISTLIWYLNIFNDIFNILLLSTNEFMISFNTLMSSNKLMIYNNYLYHHQLFGRYWWYHQLNWQYILFVDITNSVKLDMNTFEQINRSGLHMTVDRQCHLQQTKAQLVLQDHLFAKLAGKPIWRDAHHWEITCTRKANLPIFKSRLTYQYLQWIGDIIK